MNNLILIVTIIILVIILIIKETVKFPNRNNNSFTNQSNIIIITRFSIFDCNANSWQLKRESTDCSMIRNKLFDNKRLETKLNAFRQITYKSITEQTNQNFIWLIYISNIYPEKYLKIMKDIINSSHIRNKIRLIPVQSMSEFMSNCSLQLKKISPSDNFISVRLDDDDGLSPNFLSALIKYKDKSRHIISFPKGINITLKDNRVIYGSEIMYKKIALGLSAVNMNIYSCGSHTKVDQKYPVIYDYLNKSYYLFCSQQTDTKREFK